MTGQKRSGRQLIRYIEDSQRVHICAPVFFEWRRGSRSFQEIEDQELLFPPEQIVPFGPVEALLAADLYRKIRRPRGRETDIAIAACAIAHKARFWALNPRDFKDIPRLVLV